MHYQLCQTMVRKGKTRSKNELKKKEEKSLENCTLILDRTIPAIATVIYLKIRNKRLVDVCRYVTTLIIFQQSW